MLTGLVAGCGGSSSPTAPQPVAQLPLLETHALTIPEPSDVTIDDSGTRLWMVGNHPELVYQLDLKGNLVKTLSYVGNDLEGVIFDRRDSTLWVAEENLHRVVHLDLAGNVLLTHSLGFTTEHNSGLEGICLNDSGRMFVLNEKHPRHLRRTGCFEPQRGLHGHDHLRQGLLRHDLESPETVLLDRQRSVRAAVPVESAQHHDRRVRAPVPEARGGGL
jgi:uncharacterized protein YjiK